MVILTMSKFHRQGRRCVCVSVCGQRCTGVFLDRGVYVGVAMSAKFLVVWMFGQNPHKSLWAKKDTNLVPVQATHQYTGTGQFKDSSKVCSNEPHFTQWASKIKAVHPPTSQTSTHSILTSLPHNYVATNRHAVSTTWDTYRHGRSCLNLTN